jgi:AraC-like DNA-binding protein
MSRARALLADTDLTVAEVAARVGMADPGYFSRQFRRSHGRSPREWRRTSGIGTESP